MRLIMGNKNRCVSDCATTTIPLPTSRIEACLPREGGDPSLIMYGSLAEHGSPPSRGRHPAIKQNVGIGKNRSQGWFIIANVLSLLVLTNPGFALPTDRDQIVELRAGSADINQQTHTGIYLDDVQLDQGSTHIRAHKAVTTGNEKNQLVLAVIKGNKTVQAHYWTVPVADKPPMHAYADTINYYPERHLIELVGNARVEQANNSFSAPLITYDTLAQHVVSQASGAARTTIIFHPEKRT